ncbi:hypothetical protein, partial [Janibacter anophelis]|uniref:hypothetical protein n=1 Tax=Janibacter anophelis TaxID=319054 RepID=UPI001C3F19AC
MLNPSMLQYSPPMWRVPRRRRDLHARVTSADRGAKAARGRSLEITAPGFEAPPSHLSHRGTLIEVRGRQPTAITATDNAGNT